jgi:hypothetical protein
MELMVRELEWYIEIDEVFNGKANVLGLKRRRDD